MCPASHQLTSGCTQRCSCACIAWERNHQCSWDPWEHTPSSSICHYLVQAWGWCVKLAVLSDLQDGHISTVLYRIGLKIWGLNFLLLPLNFPFVWNVQSHTLGRIFTSSALEDTCKISLLKTWSNVVGPPQINSLMAHFSVNIIFSKF